MGSRGSFKLLRWRLKQGETITPQDKTKSNTTKTKNKAWFSRLLRHVAWKRSETILVNWEGMEKQENS